MSLIPSELRYAESHEWVRPEADGAMSIGLTDHAQKALGDVVFVELPVIGKTFEAGEPVGTVESVKAASEFYAPVGGEVIAVNDEVAEDPELINQEPYDTWLVRLKPSNTSDYEKLLDATAYQAVIAE
ncbi:glycine cleavage system protein GcvH [Streptomyces sp. DSM 110735]|uniref:glycine cleavage system protein GcvH n=1 Tax=Streptomyces sp. DSM 110735 TaxID=2775031 RepID=UPI0018F71E0E|nr:glycine cleavage system protein GcvH [Streptomyces sp. DSM 110735]MBJ7902251.1 glycine cleavage system protein GcvH [Streptomyces sp. DSM 110735]